MPRVGTPGNVAADVPDGRDGGADNDQCPPREARNIGAAAGGVVQVSGGGDNTAARHQNALGVDAQRRTRDQCDQVLALLHAEGGGLVGTSITR